jgi:hypothetical protein
MSCIHYCAKPEASPWHRIQIHIWLTVPPHENIIVNRSPVDDARHEHVEVAIKDAFAIARHQIDALAI